MYNLHIDSMEPYDLTEEAYKILKEEGDLLDILENEIEYDDYEFSGECDYE
jgi:hypothetical protein